MGVHDLDGPEAKASADFHVVELVHALGQGLVQKVREADVCCVIHPVTAFDQLHGLLGGAEFTFVFIIKSVHVDLPVREFFADTIIVENRL